MNGFHRNHLRHARMTNHVTMPILRFLPRNQVAMMLVGEDKVMSQKKSYTIDKVGWHTNTPGNTEPREKTQARFRAVIDFLQDNKLTRRTILSHDDAIDDQTSIHTDDLTEAGLAVLVEYYQKWLKKVDRGLSPVDVSMFERAIHQ